MAETLVRVAAEAGPVSPIAPGRLEAGIAALEVCPDEGVPLEEVLAEVSERILVHGVRPTDPLCAAHLQCPTLLPAAVAEMAIGATNQSMDSFDQAPAATLAEDHLVRWLAGLLGLGGRASGVLSAGGTASNLLGLTLARHRAGLAAGRDLRAEGLPPEAAGWRILTSTEAHDSVRRSAALLGLGGGAVVAVAADAHGRLDPDALERALSEHHAIAVVATAGTTDLGAIDPLPAVADLAAAHGAWLHVDAAVGSALALSERHRGLIDGIDRADSVTADLHKLWWQPIGASALLVRDGASLEAVHHSSDYLNRADDEAEGVLNLVGRSLDTSRRFDALKILVALRTTGRRRMGSMVDHLLELAAGGARDVAAHPELELLAQPSTVTVAFRWRPPGGGLDEAALDRANTAAQRRLFASGRAVVGRTRVGGAVALKLTLVNPLATRADVAALLDLVADEARAAA